MGIFRCSILVAFLFAGCTTDSLWSGGDNDGGQPDQHVTLPPDMAGAGCGLRTCASVGANCGPIGDGCGGLIDCGKCTAPETCGGGGKPSVCGGTMGCVPTTCAAAGANCGALADGCGGLLSCGTCGAGQACGAGGEPNVCAPTNNPDGGVCVPKKCSDFGFNCGPAGDGCGGTLNCGTCPAGQGCGTGGSPSVCGPLSSCVPKTCASAGFNCGGAGDGCGGVISCGACVLPDVCGGGGVPNVCGQNKVDGGTCTNLCLKQVKCDGGSTVISGTVYAPTNPAAGYGNPDPIYNALVYIPNGTVQPFAAGVSCDKCAAQATGSPLVSVVTGVDGKFSLSNAPCGTNIPLVIQVGRWRRQITIPAVACCAETKLTAEQSRLPRNHTEGDMPLIAVVTGSADPIECVLPKLGIDASEFTIPTGTGRVRLYRANGATMGTGTPAASALWDSPTELSKYDAIIADCEGSQINKTAAQQKNVLDYTSKGGRLFASHYSYTWLYNIAPFSGAATWHVDQASLADQNARIDTSFPKGAAFAAWAKNVGASTTLGQLPVKVVRHDADAVVAPTQQWVYADPAISTKAPLEFTFNTPVGVAADRQCGRVLFSDFHVNTGAAGTGTFPKTCGAASALTPQEKMLEFMLFDLTSCIQPDVPPPSTCTARTCAQQGYTCGPAGDGCGNIINCGTCPAGQVCGAGGPNKCGVTCTPTTCAALGYNCGPAGDGCGGALSCGTCPTGQSCGGGKPGVCGVGTCVPKTCAQQGYTCGPAGDGCGGTLSCGTCPAGQTCGGGGKPGVCGAIVCTPITCMSAGANCGKLGDGCGGVLDCGTCPAGQTCGGGGQANVCGNLG